MNQQIYKKENASSSIERGNKIYNSNPFFRDLTGLMNNVEFHDFYNKYFHDWSDIQTMIFYMKLYKAIEYGYQTQYQSKIEPELMTFVLHKIMTTTYMRKRAMEIFNSFKESSLSDHEMFCKLIDFEILTGERLQILDAT